MQLTITRDRNSPELGDLPTASILQFVYLNPVPEGRENYGAEDVK